MSINSGISTFAGSLKMKMSLSNSRKSIKLKSNLKKETKKSQIAPMELDEGNIFDGSLFDLDNVIPKDLQKHDKASNGDA